MNIKVGVVMALLIVMMGRECFGNISIENRTGKSNLYLSVSKPREHGSALGTGTSFDGRPSKVYQLISGEALYPQDISNSYTGAAKNNADLYIENASTKSGYCVKSRSGDDPNKPGICY